ncbi:RidA family protein [Sagittula sp. NFXS13]
MELPAAKARGQYAAAILDGSRLYVSGAISVRPDGSVIAGRLPDEVSVDEAFEAARQCAVTVLARAKSIIGELDRIERLLQLRGFVFSGPDFDDHPRVLDGASTLFAEVLGTERSEHVRFAVGCSSLPLRASVEIDAVFRLRADPLEDPKLTS